MCCIICLSLFRVWIFITWCDKSSFVCRRAKNKKKKKKMFFKNTLNYSMNFRGQNNLTIRTRNLGHVHLYEKKKKKQFVTSISISGVDW